jgi:T1SS-143 domain-containing protein
MPKDINTVGSTNANKVFDLPIHLQPGQVNTLAFSQDSISSMQLTPKGELEISFRDGSKVTIADFDELADSAKSCGRDTLIQLSDNTIIYPDQLRDQLSQQGGVNFVAENDGIITLDEPKAGQILTKNIEAGQEYKLGFTLDGVNAAQSGNNLLLTFKDGGVLVLNNYFTAVNSDLPPAMTLANGATIDANALLTSCKLVEVPNAAEAVLASAPPQSELRQSVPDIEPAAGEEATLAPQAKDVARASGVDLANIEPAAGGDGAARVSGSARGYGFGSSIDGAAFNGQNPIGAIGATALNYSAPTIGTIPNVPGVISIPDDKPSLGEGNGIVDETNIGSVSGVIPVSYGRDGPGALTLNSNFTSQYALTSGGVPVIVSLVGNTYTGTAGGLPVFTLVLDPITGDYTFTQIKQLDHADPTNPNDSVGLVFGVTATDRDGDTATTTITINVLDDGPVAVDDGVFVVNDTLTVSGNVLSNDDAGSDGLGRVTSVSFNGANVSVPLTGSISVVGAYGTLVIASNGSYTYTSSNTALGTDVFTYTMVDFDGDSSTAKLSLEVEDLDEKPVVVNAVNQLDETGVAPDGTESVSGKVVVDFKGDGPGVVDASGAFTSGGSQKAGALTSNGVAVAVTMSGDVYTGTAGGKTVFTLSINDDGTYTYTQVGQLDHADGTNANDVISLNFGFKATDADGDVANGTITIKVLDDAPVAVNDVATLASAPGSVSGNVLGNDTIGTDKPGYVVKTITFEGNTVNVPTVGTVTIAGANGTLSIGANGAYTYTGSKVGSDAFTYSIVDQDGDTATAKLTVTVADVDECPVVVNAVNQLDETGVAPDGTESVSGKVVVDFKGDGPGVVDASGAFTSGGSQKAGALTSNGVAVAVTMAGDVYTGTAGGKTVFTLSINDDGTYTYTQVGQLDHADGTNANDVISLNFGFKATDADGDVANGTITIKVLDDAPVAVNDVATLASAPGSVSGNVLGNDTIGTDKPGYVVKTITFEGNTVNVPTVGTVTIAGANGTLSIGANGAYTYTGSKVGSDAFTYSIVDQDGDTATAKLTVTVADVDECPVVVNAVNQLDETGVAPDGTESVSGKVVVDFKGDGPGVVDASGAFTSGGSQKAGALTSNGVAVAVTMSGDVYTGTAGGKTVFTLSINDDGTYTYTQVGQLDHADGTNANDVISLNFGFKATDADGDVANGTITIKVLDDAPVAVNDVATLASAPGSVSGNVLGNDTIGTDKPGYVVKTITFEGNTVNVPTVGTVTIAGANGTLSIGASGAYTYTGSKVGSDAFTYSIVDQDGDTATAKLTVTVADVDECPVVVNAVNQLDETGVAPDGTESVSGKVVVDFKGDGPGVVDASGAFTSGGSQKGGALTSNGVAVAVTMSGDVYTGTAGGKTVFTLSINDDGTYTYTQVGQLDHADGTNANDVISLNFGFKATDADGDVANGTITIKVLDDAPVAVNDVATLASAPGSVSGNVLGNDTIGTDKPGYVVKTITFEGNTVNVPTVGTVTIAGANGTLSIGANGAYTYTGSKVGSDAFTYSIVDQDGDTATAKLTVTVADVDECPVVVNAVNQLDETGVAPDGTESVSGKVVVDFKGDGPGVVDASGAFTSGGSQKAGALTSNGVAVAVTMSGDVYTGTAGGKTVFTLSINDDGTYTYTQVGQLDHADGTNANDVISLNFGFKATDADGDVANGTITIKVLDDAPVAVNDVATLASAPGSVSGNVLGNDTIGTDKPGYVVKTITFEGNTVNVPTVGTVTIAGANGTLSIGANGAYTYTGSKVGSDAFTYSIVDQDGDTATAKLTVTVADVDECPVVVNAVNQLDETGVAPDGTESVSGKVVVDFKGDGPGVVDASGAFTSGGSQKAGALTSNGVAVAVTMSGDVYTGTAGGKTVFTLSINDDGTYTYTQVGQLDHADGTNANDVISLNFGFKATDADGDVANGTITIKVLDDAPVAVNDVATLASAPGSVSGNVLGNDTIGTDKPGYVVKTITFEGNTVNVPTVGTVTIAGANGTLSIGANGAYTYTGSKVGSDAFTYSIVDQDGDTATAKLTVTVADVDECPVVVNAVNQLDETGVAPDGTESVSGKVVVDFKGDGPGVVDASGAFTSGGSQKAGALTSNGVAVAVTMSGDVYTGTAGGKTVFTLSINDDGTYTYTQVGQLDHADGTNANDVISLNFGFKATDADGDVANGTITIKVLDDAPVAVNDVATLASAPGSVSGNVLGNDTIGTDKPGYVVKTITFEGNTVNVPTVGTVTIAGANGTLSIGANGAYTYTGSKVGSDAFTYSIVDQDGDTATAKLTVTVADVDECPVVVNAVNQLDETGVAPDGTESVSGKVVVDFKGDGPGVVDASGAFTSGGSQKAGALTSNGVAVAVTMSGDVYTGTAGGKTVFTLSINDDGTYTYTQVGQLDHADGTNANDVISLNFGFKATDADGDVANGTITIKVLDDAPVAVNDVATLASAPGSVSGNVLGNDTIGTDKPGYVVKTITFEGNTVNVPTVGTVTIAGANGTLSIGANGAYTYTGSKVGSDAFTYSIVDQDGDTATAKLTVTVADVDECPVVVNAVNQLDETGVAPDGTESVSGKVVVDFKGDGPGVVDASGAFTSGGSQKAGALTSNGVAVAVTMAGDVYTGTAGGKTVFTLSINDDGTYTYTQVGQLDHADGTNANDVISLNFGFKATDADGDVANGTITIKVLDDAPVAVNDVATLASAPGSVSGNVLGNDTIGTDKPGYVVKTITFEGNTVNVPTVGTVTIAGANGTLSIGANGAYTYTGSKVGSDAFTYSIVDQDGDTATAKLTVTVADVDECPVVVNAVNQLDETGVAPDGTESVSGKVVVDFKGDGPGVVDASGAFTSGGSQKAGALTSNGVAVAVTMSGDVYTGTAGGKTVFTLSINDDGTYTYTQVGQLDHADGTNANDVISLNFGFKATDADGDVANGTITIKVLDDAPVAVNDVATLASAPGSVSGNVLGNDTIGTDKPGYVVKTITFEGNTVNVPTVGTVTIAGANGTLSIGANGAYTYTGSKVGSDAFTYSIVDQDGDTATAKLTVTVADVDECPVVVNAVNQLDETGVAPDGTESVSGKVVVDFKGDGPGVVDASGAFTSGGSQKAGALTSNGVAVAVTMAGDVYTGTAGGKTVFTLSINDDGTYTYTQVGQLDHADGTNANDVISLNFGFKATDADGDVANGTITIKVLDDAPVAVNDVATLASAPGSVSGNVLGNDTIGTDKPGYVVKTITFEGNTVNVPTVGTVTIAGANGTLSIGANGAYTYTGSKVGSDAFTYSIVDQDGDTATAKLTVTVADVDECPVVVNAVNQLDETGVAPDGTESVSGKVVVDFKGDGPGVVDASGAFTSGGSQKAGALTSNGVAVAVTMSGDVYTGTAGGKTVFTLSINDDGTYTYTQVGQLDHADGTNANDVISLNFGFKATDADGDVANGTITIKVLDDAPVAVNDVATLASAPGSVSGNVLGNDTIGTDKPGYVVKTITFEGNTVNVPTVGTVTIAGANGTLSIGANGAYTYTGSKVGSDAFTYSIVDQDGDTATAKLTVTVADVDECPVVVNAVNQLDETGVAPDGTESVSGKVVVDFKGDGPGVVDASGAFTSGGSQKAGALTSNGVAVAVTMAGDVYTGTAGGKTVFTLSINDDGTYTYTQVGQLDHADGTNANDVISLNFGFKATDADGDVANGTITIKVLDDAPVAVNDVATLASAPGSVSGNVLGNDTIGTDKPGYVVKTITFEGNTVNVPTVGTVTIAGANGTLSIGANGAYTYTGSKVGSDAFTYSIVDQDGDTATAKLTVTVADVDECPVVVNAVNQLDETGVAPDGTESVSGKVVVDFKGDGPGVVDASGAFTSGGSQKAGALTSNGVAVAVTMSGDVYTGTAGGKTVFTLSINDDGTYTYTQVGQLDHADGTNANDVISLNFGFKATDADGDVANGTITIKVLDDAPVAVNDVATLASAPGSVSGNVLGNDTIGTDKPGYVVKTITFEGNTVNVPTVGTVTIAGANGTLSIGASGAYTYTGSKVGSDAFTYSIVDQDGDTATAKLTVTVADVDECPVVVNAVNQLDETGVAPDGTESVSGKVVVDFKGDGPGVVDASGAFTSGGSQKGGALTSNGVAVAVTMSGDVYTGTAGGKTVFTLSINDDGTYTYTQVGQLDHADGTNANDVISLNFGFKATDADGDVANGTITIKVLDDAPVAVNDVATLASAPGSVSGNVLGNDTIGTDKPGYVVKTITFEGNTVNVPTVGTVTIAGANGTLSIGANGAYTYTGSKVGSDAFTYSIVDQDGDTATAKLTVTVADVDECPVVVNAVNQLDETGVAPDGTESVSGKVVVDFKGDGPGVVDASGAFTSGGSQKAGALTSNGVAVAVTMSGDVYTGTAGGKTVFTLSINDDGTYTYTQVGQLDHADGTNANDVISLNFGFKATDADGDVANGTITIKVLDDAPVAVNDSNLNVTKIVTGNVLSNDYQGTDAPSPVVKITYKGVDYSVPAVGSSTIIGDHGSLVIKADGSYTYTPTSAGTDNFTYTILDRDSDQSTAILSLKVVDNIVVDLNVNGNANSICVKEDGSVAVPVIANVTGGNGNEVLTLTLTGVAANWNFSATGWTQVSAGTYSITLPAGQANYSGSFNFAPPANSDVDLNGLKITASVYDPDLSITKTSIDNLIITVDAVADIPLLNVTLPAYYNNDPSRWTFSPYYNYKFYGYGESYSFAIKGTVTDTDGSEKISHYTIELPKALADLGITFSAGTQISHGVWRIEAGQEDGLKMVMPVMYDASGQPWNHPNFMMAQGIHNIKVTTYNVESNLSGVECDTSDNMNSNSAIVQVVIFATPLIIDLNGDGINLTTAENGVWFDINGDGVKDKTGWVKSDDGLLVLDKNHNGTIDGQSELFGGNDIDGFSVLAQYDENKDGVIDSKDSVWKDLKVWQDVNQDGLTQDGELLSMDDLDFSSISLDVKAADYMISGNGVSAESTVTGKDGSQSQIVDAWFAFYNGADEAQMEAVGGQNVSLSQPISF